jgi:hypothetical protein
MVMLKAMMRPVMMVWAKCRGAGLIFILLCVFLFSSLVEENGYCSGGKDRPMASVQPGALEPNEGMY